MSGRRTGHVSHAGSDAHGLRNDGVYADTLIVDTGSANTWVGAQLTNPYVPDLTDTPLGPVVRNERLLFGSIPTRTMH